jgi:hypothetical protein
VDKSSVRYEISKSGRIPIAHAAYYKCAWSYDAWSVYIPSINSHAHCESCMRNGKCGKFQSRRNTKNPEIVLGCE